MISLAPLQSEAFLWRLGSSIGDPHRGVFSNTEHRQVQGVRDGAQGGMGRTPATGVAPIQQTPPPARNPGTGLYSSFILSFNDQVPGVNDAGGRLRQWGGVSVGGSLAPGPDAESACSGPSRSARPSAAIALAIDLNQRALLHQPVHHRHGAGGAHVLPLAQRFVGRHQQGVAIKLVEGIG